MVFATKIYEYFECHTRYVTYSVALIGYDLLGLTLSEMLRLSFYLRCSRVKLIT